MEPFDIALLILIALGVACAFVGLLVSFARMAASASKMIEEIRPGVTIWHDLWGLKGNVVFRPHLLKETGLTARRQLIRYTIQFVIFAMLNFVVAIWYGR
jgi:hypothetical protein